MAILTLNCGSSSIKAAVFSQQAQRRLLDIRITGIGEATSELIVEDASTSVTAADHAAALVILLQAITNRTETLSKITAVGHRIVHGGEQFSEPAVINDEVVSTIGALTPLAPLHNRAGLAGILAARAQFGAATHVAVFDTAFHSTLPACAKTYALSDELTTAGGFRRFGFHGINHQHVSLQAAQALATPLEQLRTISCHLGNGCSITAIEGGRSVDTSMGMTPLEGLVMGRRSGDLDPGIVVALMREHVKSVDDLDDLLNRRSGLLGMTGSSDMREIETRAASGDENCRRAIDVFSHRARKYIGAYAAVMGGVDAIAFTGGIGENSALIRDRIAQRLDYLGACLDEDRNRNARVSLANPIVELSAPTSRVKLLAIAANEEAAIATAVKSRLSPQTQTVSPAKPIPVAVRAGPVHLTQQ